MQSLPDLTTVKLMNCTFQTVPSGIEYLKAVTELDLTGCSELKSLPESVGHLANLTSLTLTQCKNLTSLPRSIVNLSKLTTLNLEGCSHLEALPDIFTLPNLHFLIWEDGQKWEGDDIRELTSLDLRSYPNLTSLPPSIGNLSHLTSFNLRECPNLISLTISISRLTHLNTPFYLAGIFSLPSDMDWSEFPENVTLPLYLDYMMRRNKTSSIISPLSQYMKRFDLEVFIDNNYELKGYGYLISNEYELIKRRRERGADMIKHLCLILTNGGMRRVGGYGNQIVEWRDKKKKRVAMNWLKTLYLNVYGMEMEWEGRELIWKRMKQLWKAEGKEDEERTRKWERRWRNASAVMEEEAVMEISVMHLCMPDYERKEKYGLIVPTECSYEALSIFLTDLSDTESTHHFTVYDINYERSNTVIIRNLPPEFTLGN